MNWFFLESNLVFSKQVDWLFFNYNEVILLHILRQVIEGKYYEFNQLYFNPALPESITRQTQFYQGYFGDSFFQTRYEKQGVNWSVPTTIENLVTDYNHRFGYKGIVTVTPTAAVIILAIAADAGFKDIRLAGVDFYMDSTPYIYHPLPQHLAQYRRSDFFKEQHNKLNKLLGRSLLKEDYWRPQITASRQTAHAIEMDKAVINHILSSYPDIQLTVFCSDKAQALWKEIKGVKVLTSKDLPASPTPPLNPFISSLNTITLTKQQRIKITLAVLENTLARYIYFYVRDFIASTCPKPVFTFIQSSWRLVKRIGYLFYTAYIRLIGYIK